MPAAPGEGPGLWWLLLWATLVSPCQRRPLPERTARGAPESLSARTSLGAPLDAPPARVVRGHGGRATAREAACPGHRVACGHQPSVACF